MSTMESLEDDNVEDILLRLPSWTSLGHAVRTTDSFRHIASNPDFLRRFCAGHASASPRGLLGVFAQRYSIGLPVFILASPARSDPGLLAVLRAGDFNLGDLEDDPEWAVHDFRNGRLLLSKSKGRSLTIYDPASRHRIDISLPQDDSFPNGCESAINCLLADDEYASSFRVVSLQVYDHGRRLRAVEYDSRVQEWRFHPWAADAITPPKYQTMYAAGLIFWNHEGIDDSATFMLDTRTMEFSRLRLPAKIEAATRWMRNLRCSMGETEDGKCCLVYMSNDVLQMWLLAKNRSGGYKWEFQKEKPLADLLPGHNCDEHYLRNVVAGLVILRAGNKASLQYHHYALDLKNLSVKEKIPDGGYKTVIYPVQLPWPPAGLSPTKRRMLQIDTTRKDTEKKQKTSSSSRKGLSQKNKVA